MIFVPSQHLIFVFQDAELLLDEIPLSSKNILLDNIQCKSIENQTTSLHYSYREGGGVLPFQTQAFHKVGWSLPDPSCTVKLKIIISFKVRLKTTHIPPFITSHDDGLPPPAAPVGLGVTLVLGPPAVSPARPPSSLGTCSFQRRPASAASPHEAAIPGWQPCR